MATSLGRLLSGRSALIVGGIGLAAAACQVPDAPPVPPPRLQAALR